MKPIDLLVARLPTHRIAIGEGGAVDLTEALDSCLVEITPDGAWAQIRVRVNVDIAWPVEVQHVGDPSILDEITAEEINAWAATGGASEGPGRAILEHIRARLAGV